MTDEAQAQGEATLFPKSVGERLRDARVAQKLDLADIAQRTRVPLRHLQAIEDGDYAAIPTPTYAIGFARAYARAVGEDEVEVAREVRGRSEAAVASRRSEYQPYAIVEPPRTPSRGLMLGAGLIALVLLLGVLAWFGSGWLRGEREEEPAAATAQVPGTEAETPAPTAAPAATGQVTLVATDEVWVRIYDAANTTLKIGTLKAGERFDVPADANGPMINVGRPDKLQVLVNGSEVAPLGTGRIAIKDVAISAAALAARNQPAPATGPANAGTDVAPATQPAAAAPSARPSPGASRSVPPFFRGPAAAPTRTQAAPASTGQRDAPAADGTGATGTTTPGNGF